MILVPPMPIRVARVALLADVALKTQLAEIVEIPIHWALLTLRFYFLLSLNCLR